MILEKIQMIVDRPDSDGTRLRFHKNSGRVFISQSNDRTGGDPSEQYT